MNKKIAIILVNYNGLKDTIECIESIYKSNYDNYEIIVIDNASAESSEALMKFDKVYYKKLSDNFGFGVANNIGAEIALNNDAELIMCLNNDTIIDENLLLNMSKLTDDRTITTCAMYYYEDKKELWYGGGTVSRIKGNFRHRRYKENKQISFVTGCCFMFTASCYKEIGLFDDNYFMYCEDADFSLKATQKGYKLLYIFSAKLWHKVGRSMGSYSDLREYYLTRNRLYLLKKYRKEFVFTAFLYYYFTRGIYILKAIVLNKNYKVYIEAISDYKKMKMKKKD